MSRARDFANLAGSADVGGITGRNMIINGNMAVAQRGTSQTGITGGGYKKAPDRYNFNAVTAGTWTVSQSTTAPEGFPNSYKVECTTADASLAAGDVVRLRQRIEGQNLQQLKKGTSNAESVTLSFYVRSSKTGTYIVEITDQDNSRHIAKSYSITTADTWQYVSVTYDGDTTGSLDNDNAESLTVQFFLVAGSNFTSGTLATAWASQTTANRAVGQVNLADTVGNDWYITGIQMEIGEVATPFEHESFAETLRKCQRYYSRINSNGNYTRLAYTGYWASGNQANLMAIMPVPMRAAPAVDHTGTLNDYILVRGNGVNPPTTLPAFSRAGLTEDGDCMSATIIANSTGNGSTEGHAAQLTSPGGGATGIFLGLEAEL